MRKNANNNVEMIEKQVESRGIEDENVIQAMKDIDRSIFVDRKYSSLAYADRPLPIGYNQTISQPYIVGFMTEKLDINKNHKVLEIGSGCGYQTAVLCKLAKYVYGIDIVDRTCVGKVNPVKLSRFDFTFIAVRTSDESVFLSGLTGALD